MNKQTNLKKLAEQILKSIVKSTFIIYTPPAPLLDASLFSTNIAVALFLSNAHLAFTTAIFVVTNGNQLIV